MSKKEYGKGFTLDDLEAQRRSVWETRRQVGLAMFPKGAPVEPPVTGPLWNAFERQDPLDRAQRSIQASARMMEGLGVITSPPNYLPGDPIPEVTSEVGKRVGMFGGFPVYRDATVPQGGFMFSTQPSTDPRVRSVQVGWAKPEPIPEQPTGRFRNLDFES